MASPGDRLGLVASAMQVTGVDAMGLVSMIVQAAHIAHRNRDQCQQLAKHVDIVASLLPELRRHPATRRTLDQLNDALFRAYMLVRSCTQQQEKTSWVYQMITGADVADKLRRAQEEIDRYISLIPTLTTIAIFPYRATYQDDETNDLTPAQRSSLSLEDVTELLALEELPPTGTVAQQPIIGIVGNVVSQPGTRNNRHRMGNFGDGFGLVGLAAKYLTDGERQQRSDPSSFTWAQLAAATNRFALEATIGEGSLGTVYRGVLPDERELAIKRCKSEQRAVRLQQKKFRSRLDFISHLRHKHIVGLMGYCIRNDECLFVYEYMKNGSLHDHLDTYAVPSPVTKSWRLRLKILLDACRGIEYLHSYAVPPVVHDNIKSSNILQDGGWTARVSDFGHSLMEPESEAKIVDTRSDIRSFGEVMAEVLTGKRINWKQCDNIVDEIRKLDSRVSASNGNELSDRHIMKELDRLDDLLTDRDNGYAKTLAMAEIVAILERAVALSQED